MLPAVSRNQSFAGATITYRRKLPQLGSRAATDRSRCSRRILFLLVTATLWFSAENSLGQTPVDAERTPPEPPTTIARIASGTAIRKRTESGRWNHLVLLAIPKISSGDVAAVNGTVREAATATALTIMATVVGDSESANSPEPSGGAVYRLAEVGVGYGGRGDEGWVVIDSDTASRWNVQLGFIARQVLQTNEQRLSRVTMAGKTDHAVVFDAPSVVHRRDRNRKYLTRHLLTIDPATGRGTLSVWLLVPPGSETHDVPPKPHPIIDRPIRVCSWGTIETRRIHVDADQFSLFGIPGELAFALEDLPPGEDLAWTAATAKWAGLRAFSADELTALVAALRSAHDGL